MRRTLFSKYDTNIDCLINNYSMEEIKKWLIKWFSNKSAMSIGKVTELSQNNYFESGLVDSFGFITLLSDIEEKYGVSFSNDDFLDRSFATIDGLANMINNKK